MTTTEQNIQQASPAEPRKLPPFGFDMRAPWSTLPLAVIDFETDGPNPYGCEPVQIGIVRYEPSDGAYVETGCFSTLLNPGRPIDPEAAAIHKITDEMVSRSIPANDLFREEGGLLLYDILPLVVGAIPVAFNAAFDRTIWLRKAAQLDAESRTNGPGSEILAPCFDRSLPWLCPLVITRAVDKFAPGAGRFKLKNTCERHGVPFNEDDAHDALYDCRATAMLLPKLVNVAAAGRTGGCYINGDTAVCELLNVIERLRPAQEADFRNFRIKVTS